MLEEKKVTNAPNLVKAWITQKKYIFPLLAFIVPFGVRVIPEILMGPYIVGFDTMGFYVSNSLLWLHSGISLSSFLVTAPLFYTFLMPIIVAGGSAVFALKIISPLLLGFLGLTMYWYAKRGLSWSLSKSTFVAILGTVYFVALRASWDQLREELGLVFFFIVLTLLINPKGKSWKSGVVLSLAMLTVVLSHQLVSVLMFGVIVFAIVHNLFRKDFESSIKMILASLPAVIYFFFVYLSGVLKYGFLNFSTNVGSPLATWLGFTSYQSMLISTGGLFVYCFSLILPIALLSIWRLRKIQLGSWLLFSLILMLLPIASVSPYRWVLMLTYPLAFYATDTLSRLKSIKWKRYRINVRRIAVLYLVISTAVLSFGYIFMIPQQPFPYFDPAHFNGYSYQIPTSMLQNTISVTDCQDTENALHWFKDHENSSSILLTHTVFYSWALLSINESQVRTYGFDAPDKAAMAMAQKNQSQIYLIWWVKGHGWYDQPTLPSSFNELYYSGRIAIYSYNLSQ
jgi:hypothetical protein